MPREAEGLPGAGMAPDLQNEGENANHLRARGHGDGGGSMDEGIQTTQETDSNRNPKLPGAHPPVRRKPAGRKPKSCIDISKVAQGAAGALRKAFPWLNRRLAALSDPRVQEMCVYSGAHLWWTGELCFLTRSGSRNAFDQTRNSGAAPHNMGAVCGQTADDPRFEGDPRITCSDNVAHHLRRVDAAEAQDIPAEMCQDLLVRRFFDGSRIFGCWHVVVFDGTVQELCRTGFAEGGKSGGSGGAPYRYVLQCGLLGPGNTFFPLMHEHVDMHNPETEKEDCELKAFHRLAKRLKKMFPRLRFCIVGDALFCATAVADLCEQYHWKYVLTLKEGRQSGLWDELLNLLPLSKENRLRVWTGQDNQQGLRDFRWVENLQMGDHLCTAVLSGEFADNQSTLYAYATNFLISRDRVLEIISNTGRERHRIEDHFNAEKNNGIGLEHVFCADANASKNFFTLMQMSAIHWTLIAHGYLRRLYEWADRATDRALAEAIAEGMRALPFPDILPEPGQFRFLT